MMQGLHHQQQQLAGLLSAALPKENDPSTSSATATTSSASSSSNATSSVTGEDESSRVAAITSLHRAILYPPNSVLVTHSASFLAQGFSQLLLDKSYLVRQSAALAYGALSSVLCSVPIASNGRQNHVLVGGLVDRFMGWALPLLTNIGNGTAELALEGLHEFLNVGDVGSIERYALPILKSCQELLEDERTSLVLLRRLLGVLTLISLKFFRCFQPHFVDIVDLLLGWAMVPDLADSDLRVIMDSFLQFQKHWVNNMQFSLGLLSKFLGDMDVLLQDGSPGTLQQFQRLLALLSCFSAVLQSVASGLLEINLLEQISEPLCTMVPVLLKCLSLIGKKIGWSKWIEDSWRCLTLLAEILGDRFAIFYPAAADILFQSLDLGDTAQNIGTKKTNSFQVHGVLKTNLQLMSLQKLGLLPSFVQKILQLDGHISRLRLHPNHLVAGSAAATYVFLLQHINNEVVQNIIMLLIEELKLFKSMLKETRVKGDHVNRSGTPNFYSPSELLALTHFDLKVLLSSVSLGGGTNVIGQAEIDTLYLSRSDKLVSFIIQEFDPFSSPTQDCVDLQVTVLKTLGRLTTIEFLSKCSMSKQIGGIALVGSSTQGLLKEENSRNALPIVILEYLRKYSVLLVKVLGSVSALAVKLEALEWIRKFCGIVIEVYVKVNVKHYPCNVFGFVEIMRDLLLAILNAASDREPKVRSLVPALLDILLQAKLVHPTQFYYIAEVVLEKLGDPDDDIRSAFVRLLSHVLPITMYVSGLYDYDIVTTWRTGVLGLEMNCKLHWKQVFLLKQLPQQLRSQQLVSILSYISQRWKVPLSSWIHRLICTCRSSKERASIQLEEAGYFNANSLLWDIKIDEDILERVCFVNNLAGAWWAVNEAARYCISTRLRTNLGGPSQTFAALERMLLDIAHVLQLDTDQSDGNLNINSSSYAHLLPMRLLLDFVESLKKNVYNAYEGSVVLPSANRQSSLFFRANKKVCEEWFSRICEPMMNAGLALQCHDATIHYCGLRLLELNSFVSSALKDKSRMQVSDNLQNMRGRFAGEILRVVQHMALALCRNHQPEALIGLQKWASLAFAPLFQEEDQICTDGEVLQQFSWITGLVYQGEGQHEKAAAHFINLLQTEDSLSSLGSECVQFVIARIIDSYTAVSDWKSLESWLLELQALRAKHAGKNYSGALTTAGNEINSVQALARFDEGDFQASWACLDLTPKSSSELTLDPKLALQRSEQMLLQAMLFHSEGKLDKVSQVLQKAQSMLDEILSILPLDGPVDAAPYIHHLYCIFAFESSCNSGGSQDEHYQPLLGSYIQNVQSPMNHIYQDCSLWLKVLRICQTTEPTSPITLKLGKNLLHLARKQGNLLLANRLSSYLSDHATNCSDKIFHDYLVSSLQYESILLMHAEDKLEDAFTNLWLLLRPLMLSSSLVVSNSYEDVLKAKACLKFSNWLQGNCSDSRVADIVLKMLADLNRTQASPCRELPNFLDDNLNVKPNVSVAIEGLVGWAMRLSTQLCPTMAKSWISYASWCYSQGRMSVAANHASLLSSCSYLPPPASEVLPQNLRLSEEDQLKIKGIVLQLIQKSSCVNVAKESNEEFDALSEYKQEENALKSLFDQIVDIIESGAEATGTEDHGEGLSAIITSKLKNCLACASVTLEDPTVSSCLNDLVNVWWSLRKKQVALFGHAAEAFINYLSYSSSQCSDGQLTGPNGGSKCVSYTLRATLYVLNILLSYGVELKDTLEPALSTVPLLPWQEIIPQLFARLSSHPEQVVRQQLESLLVMLAKLAPWSVVYPTLVDANTHEKEPSGELQQILACLNKLYPKLVQDAKLMIKELENVTVLWEELWLSTLQDLHADVVRRLNLLKEEAARIAENITLSHGEKNKINAAKYSAMMAPIVVVLERRLYSTSRKPETPHEMWFYEEYGNQIKAAILKFKSPPASAAALGEVWRPFENIAASLSSYQRKSSVSLAEVAPQLAQMSSSEAPMPGLERHRTAFDPNRSLDAATNGIVTIASFSDNVAILSTKTKPKKLVIIGSDGQKYTYLLKGREDLRLDARIMQLLQAVNGFLNSSSVTRYKPLGIRYYSVTPISGRAGLIQWVDNVISIYTVFKSWQTRVQQAQLSVLNSGNTTNAGPPPVPRPVDMFYGKIIPALKEKGIRRVISRRDWPHEVKRKVLLDLMEEAPKQILHQELWCASDGFRAFSLKTKRYSGSVAAMSIVGHMLGLGDRHLDNILIDFCSGDILHIDYNVCFDKGQRLKVPEIVPFRLTQTIEAALGLTGIEGAFRMNCEAVLSVVKKNKDIILMLLEAFVWDPLVEWTREDFHDDAAIVGEERKGMEIAVSLSLFASRVQEIRVPLQEHHDLLLAALPAAESALERFVSILNQYEIISVLFHRIDHERSNLLLREASAKSIVSEATSTSESIRASLEIQAREFAQAQALVMEKAQEATNWIEQHGRILDALRSNSIAENYAWVQLTSAEESLSLTSAVLVAGVPLTVVPEPTQAQCCDIDREVSVTVSELDSGLSSLVTSLQTYSLALQRILPLNYLTTSPVHAWAHLLQLSVNTLSSDVLSLTRKKAAEIISKFHADKRSSYQGRYDELCIKVDQYVAEIEKIEEEYEELVNSLGPETESHAKDQVLSAFVSYMQTCGLMRTEDTSDLELLKLEGPGDARLQGESEVRKGDVLHILNLAAINLYGDVKHRVLNSLNRSFEVNLASNQSQSELEPILSEFEEQIEKCILIVGFLNELKKYICPVNVENISIKFSFQENWAAVFQASLLSCKSFVQQMIEAVLPEVVRCVISFNSEMMDIFGSLSQIKGSIDTALEQLIQVELERASLIELEQNYFLKVGLITEQQLALEEAAVKSRDHLSWEEAEELASQEEACKVQLDKLHQTWNQKDLRTTSLVRKEENVVSSMVSSKNLLQSLTSPEQEQGQFVLRGRVLLTTLMQPFSELESADQALTSFDRSVAPGSGGISHIVDLVNSGRPLSDYIWKFPAISSSYAFFMWKISLVDSFLDSCTHNIASFLDQNLGFDQLVNTVKEKLEVRLQDYIGQYLRERVAPALLGRLDKECETLKHMSKLRNDLLNTMKIDPGTTKKVQDMLEEYCNAHETVRAARSAASVMKRQINDLKEALLKTVLEIVQMEWMHDIALSPLQNNRLIPLKFLLNDDNLLPVILKISRGKLLESIRSSIAKIAKSLESLQACEHTSVTAEGQLERAMIWACGGPSSSTSGNNMPRNAGIPPEFHNHLTRRRELLWETREKASEIMKICISILEFESSRDGIFHTLEELYPLRPGADGRGWQQVYLNILTTLDVTYHSFTRTEQEWRLAQSNMEAASSGFFSASNELSAASVKVKSASGDLQSTLLAMRDGAYEASVALSAFAGISRGHTALTSECGSMLEEVLAITEGLHDVHSLGKEAAALHSSLSENLSKVNAILLPLESMLSKDVAAMTDAMVKEQEMKMEISPIHGQAILRSYSTRVKEACEALRPLLPSLTSSVKGLYSMLTRLARTASLHAGNLHKALEGLGESQEERSQNNLSRSDLVGDDVVYGSDESEIFTKSEVENHDSLLDLAGLSLEDKGWISPPTSISSGSSELGVISADASLVDSSNSSDVTDPLFHISSIAEVKESPQQFSSYGIDLQEKPSPGHSGSTSMQENSEGELVLRNEVSFSNQYKGEDGRDSSIINSEALTRATRGRNNYAMSVLRRVEMKLDGRDITDKREISISEQVDFLLRQATSVDNLCNMYEGWTPWI